MKISLNDAISRTLCILGSSKTVADSVADAIIDGEDVKNVFQRFSLNCHFWETNFSEIKSLICRIIELSKLISIEELRLLIFNFCKVISDKYSAASIPAGFISVFSQRMRSTLAC